MVDKLFQIRNLFCLQFYLHIQLQLSGSIWIIEKNNSKKHCCKVADRLIIYLALVYIKNNLLQALFWAQITLYFPAAILGIF